MEVLDSNATPWLLSLNPYDSTIPAEYQLKDGSCTIGRSNTNQIVVLQSTASRQHACIERQGRTYVLFDLGSTNGTFVNRQPVYDIHILTYGDVIGFGDPRPLVQFVRHQYQPDTNCRLSPENAISDIFGQLKMPKNIERKLLGIGDLHQSMLRYTKKKTASFCSQSAGERTIYQATALLF